MVKMDGEESSSCPTSLAPSDCSFVVLESPSLLESGGSGQHPMTFPSLFEMPLRKLQHNGQVDSTVLESLTLNASCEEIQKKLKEVFEENVELKEILNQNNLAMKNHLATLLAWQTQVKAVFQQHGEKFADTGTLIRKLREENMMLKNIIEEQKSSQIITETEGSKLEELLKVENAELKQTVAELRQCVSELRQRPSRESPSSKELELVSLLTQVNEKLEAVERSRRQMGVDLERVNAQRTKLEHNVAQLKTQLAKEQSDKVALHNQISAMAASKLEQHRADEPLSRQVSELQVQCEQLLSDKEKLAQKLESMQISLHSNEQQRVAYIEVQSQGFQEKLDRLTAQLVEQKEVLTCKDVEIMQLQEATRKLQLENEGLEILKAQVDVYQSDFNAEREGRERLAGEREQLLEQLSLLQRANQELSKKFAASISAQPVSSSLGSASWNTIAAPSRHQRLVRQPSPVPQVVQEPPRTYDEEVPPPRRFVCPLCGQVFPLLDHLEHHVDTCIS